MELSDIHCDALASLVVPRSGADSIARVHRAGFLSAQISAPHCHAAAGSRSQRLTIRVSTGQSTIVGPVAFTDARDKEAHGLRRCFGLAPTRLPCWVLSDQDDSAEQKHRRRNKNSCN